MLDERTLHYAHLQSNKETTVWTSAFSLCMSPTLQMAVSMRYNNVASFCEECLLWRAFGFHLTATYVIFIIHFIVRRVCSDSSTSAYGPAGPGFDTREGRKLYYENVKLGARSG